jgi:hypothetical protein
MQEFSLFERSLILSKDARSPGRCVDVALASSPLITGQPSSVAKGSEKPTTGHGGKDNGGTSGRGSNPFQREKDLALDTAKRLRKLLRRSGFRVVMTHEGDYFIG